MIYFIGDYTGDLPPENEKGFIKIGFVDTSFNDPNYRKKIFNRIKSIQTGNPKALYVKFLIDGDLILEKRFHKLFARFRKNGEWFGYDDFIVEFFTKEYVSKEKTYQAISLIYPDQRESKLKYYSADDIERLTELLKIPNDEYMFRYGDIYKHHGNLVKSNFI